jgi:hypothetical protein
MQFKVLVCGGRDYTNKDKVFETLDMIKEICENNIINSSEIVIIHGGARGADNLAGMWAKANNIQSNVYLADWKAYGNRAGPIRNQLMLKSENPDIVVAFPGGNGTNHMVSIARKNNTEVYIVEDKDE